MSLVWRVFQHRASGIAAGESLASACRAVGSAKGYKRPAKSCNAAGRTARLAGVALLGFWVAGCSLTMPFTAFKDEPETTASITRAGPSRLDPTLDDEDWRRAQAALSLAVDPQGPGLAVNWDNPQSKRRGSFTAAGDMALVDNTICRPFSAVLVQPGGKETRPRGQACRVGPGEWALRLDPVAETREALAQPLPLATTSLGAGAGVQEKAR